MATVPEERKQEAMDAGIAEEHAEKTWRAFNIYDEDDSGSISKSELRKVLQLIDCDVSENSVEKMLKEFDRDDDGTLNFAEYCQMAAKKSKEKSARQKKLKDAFETFDKDGSGFLEREEIKDALTTLGMDPIGEEDIDELLDCADLDGDGKLSIDEFVRVLTMSMDEMMEQNED